MAMAVLVPVWDKVCSVLVPVPYFDASVVCTVPSRTVDCSQTVFSYEYEYEYEYCRNARYVFGVLVLYIRRSVLSTVLISIFRGFGGKSETHSTRTEMKTFNSIRLNVESGLESGGERRVAPATCPRQASCPAHAS